MKKACFLCIFRSILKQVAKITFLEKPKTKSVDGGFFLKYKGENFLNENQKNDENTQIHVFLVFFLERNCFNTQKNGNTFFDCF